MDDSTAPKSEAEVSGLPPGGWMHSRPPILDGSLVDYSKTLILNPC